MEVDNLIYEYWCDGSCYHTSDVPEERTMGMGVYYLQTNPDTPFSIERRLAIAGPEGTHNQAEYLAIVCALYDFYIMVGAKRSHKPYTKKTEITIHSDSQIVIRQITGQYCARHEDMSGLLEEIDHMLLMLDELEVKVVFKWNPRGVPNQQEADHLSKVGNPYFVGTVADESVSHMISTDDEYIRGATSVKELLLPEIYERIKEKLGWMD